MIDKCVPPSLSVMFIFFARSKENEPKERTPCHFGLSAFPTLLESAGILKTRYRSDSSSSFSADSAVLGCVTMGISKGNDHLNCFRPFFRGPCQRNQGQRWEK